MTPNLRTLQFLAGIALCAAAATAGAKGGIAALREDACKNHFILEAPFLCPWKQAAPMSVPRSGHTATLLRDGRVLVVGGDVDYTVAIPAPSTAEIYDPATGNWRFAGSLFRARQFHVAVLLEDGRVLVAGGENHSRPAAMPRATAEIYDPATDRWSFTAPLNDDSGRTQPAASLLDDGRVLLTGGDDSASRWGLAEIYDARADRWTLASPMPTRRYGHSATPLPDGRILFTAGVDDDWLVTSTAAVETYDQTSGLWHKLAPARFSRAAHTTVGLADGKVIAAGGWISEAPAGGSGWMSFGTLASTEVYDAGTGRWTRAPDLRAPRFEHTATLLPDGSLLFVGGMESGGNVPQVTYEVHSSAELRADAFSKSAYIASLREPRFRHTATLLPDGSVLVVGGGGADHRSLRSVEILGGLSGE